MNLRQIKRRRDAVTSRQRKVDVGWVYFDGPSGSLDDSEDDGPICRYCGGSGMDPWSDYVLPCPECGEG